MDSSALAIELIQKTGALMKTSFWPKKANTFLHGEMFILNFMAHRNESVIPSELASAMNTSSARVAMALKSMEKKGFITRRIDTEDRRRINVSLTPDGRELVEAHKRDMRKKVEVIINDLGEEDTREYIRIVERMTKIAGRVLDAPEETVCHYRKHKEHWHG